MIILLSFLLLFIPNVLSKVSSGGNCPNSCNGHGQCDIYARCTCYAGYTAADCSQRLCPTSIAWADIPVGIDDSHHLAECSNKGLCDRTTGQCQCMEGYTGSACERLACMNNCNNRGVCMSLENYALTGRNALSQQFAYNSPWDAEKVYGCVCDYQATGYDCSLTLCPTGDDPLTGGQVNEVQLLECVAASGSFVLYFMGLPSLSIPYNAQPSQIASALLAIPYLTGIKVSSSLSHGAPACLTSSEGINIISIEFTQQFGALPPLVAVPDAVMSSAGGTVFVNANGYTTWTDSVGTQLTSVIGTKEDSVCSHRGNCNAQSGVCECSDTNGDVYASSDGYGGPGTRGDCGYVLSTSLSDNKVSSCPGLIACSGHGVCDTVSYSCYCNKGWQSADCSLQSCPYGGAWFTYPLANQLVHSDVTGGYTGGLECSNLGLCDRSTGQCDCKPGFYGEACEYMSCDNPIASDPSNPSAGLRDSVQCHGHGRCMSMSELALHALDNGDATNYTYGTSNKNNVNTWDSLRVHGCYCDAGYTGYDCSLRTCVSGDDPGTYDDHSEVQLLQCVADSGNFTLSFRTYTTPVLSYNISSAALQQALAALPSIGHLEVYYLQDYNRLASLPNDTLHIVFPSKTTVSGTPLWGFFDSNETFVPINETLHNNERYDTQIKNTSLCNTAGTQIAILLFSYTPGDLPAITADTSQLINTLTAVKSGSGTVNVYSDGQSVSGLGLKSIAGSTENEMCNNRGICDLQTGQCQCFPTWTSSDGQRQGGPGFTGDCGTRNDYKYTNFNSFQV